MHYKFDILFEKKLKSGSTKVVSYRQILEDPNIFEGESLDGAQGHLSTVREGMEKGYSLNSLYLKYRDELFGKTVSEMCPEGLTLFFDFSNNTDPTSLRLNLVDSEGYPHHVDPVSASYVLITNEFEFSLYPSVFICTDGVLELKIDERYVFVSKGDCVYCSNNILAGIVSSIPLVQGVIFVF